MKGYSHQNLKANIKVKKNLKANINRFSLPSSLTPSHGQPMDSCTPVRVSLRLLREWRFLGSSSLLSVTPSHPHRWLSATLGDSLIPHLWSQSVSAVAAREACQYPPQAHKTSRSREMRRSPSPAPVAIGSPTPSAAPNHITCAPPIPSWFPISQP